MARDEADMLPRWIEYYGGQLGTDHLIVLDDNTRDGSTDHLPCTGLRLPPEPWKSPWAQTRLTLVNAVSRGLLACYDVVVFTDVDEFLVPDPDRYDGLLHYLAVNRDRDVIAPLGLNVLHNEALEPALDPARPLLAQRRFVKFAPGMCKPLMKRTDADWWAAFHGIMATFEIDRDLLMLHMKYCDVTWLMMVSEHRHARHQEGRGHPSSAWAVNSDDLAARLRTWAQTPDEQDVPEFDPAEPDLDDLVRDKGRGRFRSHGPQLTAMENHPLRQLPERFRAAL
jgi:hypothetical protein